MKSQDDWKKKETGRTGEDAAAEFISRNGYSILARNYRRKSGEIDIVAREGTTVCFLEVKTRHSRLFGEPEESVSRVKQKQISRTALYFLKEHNLMDTNARFDVVSILFENQSPRVTLIKNAFDMAGEYVY
ncbi:MAG: YraN family protein [Candidatus Omnitrophica bacterium]|nr:YraN family protein [Candidatus Omnitrophota bacterium]